MKDELVKNRSWWKNNRNWFLPTIIIVFSSLISLVITAKNDGKISDFVNAYNDHSVFDVGLEKIKLNQKAVEVLGEIKPIDKLAIAEGSINYSNNDNEIKATIRIKGSKANGKMDIIAIKKASKWHYILLNVRLKNSKKVINIIN